MNHDYISQRLKDLGNNAVNSALVFRKLKDRLYVTDEERDMCVQYYLEFLDVLTEVFTYAWMKLKPYEKEVYILNKVSHLVLK